MGIYVTWNDFKLELEKRGIKDGDIINCINCDFPNGSEDSIGVLVVLRDEKGGVTIERWT
jgi:hypothetical protein